MALFKLCVLGLFTLLVVRALGARGTFSERTYGLYFLFGALYGLILSPVLVRITSPYGEQGPWIAFFTALFLLLALLLPVYFAFFKSRAFTASSVADVFLVAFLVGFGADFGRQFVFALTGPEPILGYLSLPPFVFRLGEGEVSTFAGNGYWCALVALALAACVRFVRRPAVSWSVGIAALLLMAMEAGAYIVQPSGIWGALYKLGRAGAMTPWLVLIGVIALSAWEGRWSTKAREAGGFPLLEEWQSLLRHVFRGRFREAAEVASSYRTARRAEIIAAEAAASPNDKRLQEGAARLAKLAGSKRETGVPAYGSEPTRPPHWWAVWGGWIAFVFVMVALPKLPKAFGEWLWNFWGIHYAIPHMPFTILMAVLAVVVVRRLIGSAGAPARRSRPDDIVSFVAERSIQLTAFAMALAAIVYAFPERLYPYALPAGEQGVVPAHAAKTILMLLAVAATGSTLNRARKWVSAPIEQRRRFALRTSLDVLTVTVIVLLINMSYLTHLQTIHTKYGAALFRKFQGDGNYVAAVVLALAIGLVSVGLLFVARRLNRKAERFMVGDPSG